MSAFERQKQKRLITRLKNIRKFFRKHNKREGVFMPEHLYRDAQDICVSIIVDEEYQLIQMKDSRRKK
ncbi:hypothetical protein LCGC14_1975950 [marine sediment metagenome]|uniref:Uncharacterized protein n=1 Tax=marine sediment metagenome TaxID=412755 RepID=A0A0F9HNS7_9ZZZZ